MDIQDFYFPGDGPGLVNAEAASLCAKEVLQIFRVHNQLVVHIRHKAAKGFDIHKNVAPLAGEKLITKVEVNSFNGTDLLEYLKANNINRLVIIGMQTQMCVEGTIRAGYDNGFECIVIPEACATRDVEYNSLVVKAADVQASTLVTMIDGGYARVLPLALFMENPDKIFFQPLEQ
jgi:nicotinamidase-related amidase